MMKTDWERLVKFDSLVLSLDDVSGWTPLTECICHGQYITVYLRGGAIIEKYGNEASNIFDILNKELSKTFANGRIN